MVSDIYRKVFGDKLIHYTPIENLEEIKKHMILYSSNQLLQRNIQPSYMSNNLSRQIDSARGINGYVFLVFRENHPLIYKISRSNITLLRIPIDITILDLPGVLISDRVANDSNANFYTPEIALDVLRIDLCNKNYIGNRGVWEQVIRYEILIPESIDLKQYYAG